MIKYIVEDISHYCNVSLDKCSAMRESRINYYDFTFVTGGSMTYAANGETYVLNKNDAVFLKPGTIRSRHESKGAVSYVSFNFTASSECVFPFDNYMKNCITHDIKKIISVFPQSHMMQYYHSKEKIANILNYILLELSDTAGLLANNEHISKIVRYVDENITSPITLRHVCEEINLSREYTSALFKKNMGRPLTDYINERKIRLAKDLITNRGMSLKDVSEYLGYSNYNYFSRLFKRYFDISPMALKSRK